MCWYLVKTRYDSIFFGVTAHFTPDSNKRHAICIGLRFISPHTGVKKAEFIGLLLSGKYHVKIIQSFYWQWKQHGCSFQSKQQRWTWHCWIWWWWGVTIEESKELLEEGASSEVGNFDILCGLALFAPNFSSFVTKNDTCTEFRSI